MSVERGHGLTRDLAHTRPTEILIAGWDRGRPAALDLTITSPHCSAILNESCHQAGAAALAAEARKLHSNGLKCQELVHSVSCRDIWQLGQGGPQYLLKAGILLGHSPVLPEISSCGGNLWLVEYSPGSFGPLPEPSWPGSSRPPNCY